MQSRSFPSTPAHFPRRDHPYLEVFQALFMMTVYLKLS